MPTDARVVVAPAKARTPLRVEEVRLPDPGAHQVVVRQFASGICHSQLHQMHRDKPADIVLGHESTGVVVAAGGEVTHVKEGDLVMVTWVTRSRREAARPPEPALLTLGDGSTIRAPGAYTWATALLVDAQYVVKVPSDIKTDVTAIIGCAVMTGAGAVIHTAGVRKGDSVAVFGVGGVGLSAVAAAAAVGADPIIAVDLDPAKLEFAKKFGATVGVNAADSDPVNRIRELTRSATETNAAGVPVAGVDFSFDCIGVRTTMEQIVPAVRPGVLGRRKGGMAVLVGIPQTPVELNAGEIVGGEKSFVGSLAGSCSPDEDFPTFLRWYAEGKLDLDALVTARYSIDQIQEACDALEAGKIAGRSILVF